MAASLKFLDANDEDGDSFLDQIVTGGETWVKHVNNYCETKTVHEMGAHSFTHKTNEVLVNIVCNYHSFPHIKNWIATQRLDDDAELQARVNEWLKSDVNFYDDGICKLIHHYDKCLNLNGNYVEK